MSNRYLKQIKNQQSLYGLDTSFDPNDELEVEFIAGEISDIQDEAEILTTPPKAEGVELKVAQQDIKDRLDEMYKRSKRVKCPFRKRAIQKKIAELKKHGSLNRQYSVAEQTMWSGIIGVSAIGLTALAYQGVKSRDLSSVNAPLMEGQFLDTMEDEGQILAFAKPSLAYLFKKHKIFYIGEFLVASALYHHFAFGDKK
jgi:hypothetical protein